MNSILALIPARAGSKGIPDKNIRVMSGKPVLVHSIDHAKSTPLITRVIVSTDSEEYATIARDAGAEVPFLRPAEHSGDLSTDLDVFTHALTWLKENENYEPEIVVQLRPTFPLRQTKDIEAMIRILEENPDIDSVRSVTPSSQTPFKMWFMGEDQMLAPVVKTEKKDTWNLPRQLLPQVYLQNACIDVTRSSVILEKHSMTGDRIRGYVMEENFDIDDHDDIHRLEAYLTSQGMLPPMSKDGKRRICFDIDGVIAGIVSDLDYRKALPQKPIIDIIRRLKAAGHRIILATARGTMTGRDWREVTQRQMQEWGVPYDELHFGKPAADFYIDDRAIPVDYLHRHFPSA